MPLTNPGDVSGGVYSGTVLQSDVRVWNGTAVVAGGGGVATFFPTDDGTGAGNALFSEIDSVQVSASSNTATATSVPLAAVKLIAADRKSITVNVVTGTTVGAIGGATMVFAANGTTVYMTIVGNR